MTIPREDAVVSTERLAESRDSVTVVDVRPPREYRETGHVPGARNIPFERLRDPSSVAEGHLPDPDTFAELLGEAGIDREDDIVAYDGDRGVYASRFLLTAAVFGHRGRLQLLDGDYTVWQRSFDVESGTLDVEPTTYPRPGPPGGPIVGRETVERAVEGDALLVDTRTPAEYAVSHIPGAVQLGWEELVDEGTRRLKSRDVLLGVLDDRGIRRDRRIILYCNTARRLSHTYVVLRHLGYTDVSFYEGSLTDWVRAEASDWDPTSLAAAVRSIGPDGLDRLIADLGEDVLNRLKLVGLYHQKQGGYFMLRTKIPGGRLTAEQAEVIGTVADEFARAPTAHGGEDQNPIFGDGYLDLTTRQDIQMHWIRLQDVPEIWDRYEAVGLTTMQACGNSVRNVVSCPAAGIDTNEIIDVSGIADRVTDRFLADRRYANLPRKFKMSVTGCTENCARAQINDLGLTPAIKDDRDGFKVYVGGGLSDGPRMASDLDIFVEPHQVVELVEATADLFLESGSYLDTAVNRLRFLVEELGEETVREELARRVSFDLEAPHESLTTAYRGDHVGVHEQVDGHRYIGANVPTGRMGGHEFLEFAALARRYGEDELRLTLNQNLLLPHVNPDAIEQVLENPALERYSPTPGPFSRGIVACTGSEYCNFGIIETKTRAFRWARALDGWVEEHWDDPPSVVRMHLSGCSASCAQPQIADIGLRGELTRDERDGEQPAVDVGLGGDLGHEAFIDWVVGALPVEQLPSAVTRLTEAYREDRRSPNEPFTAWLRRTDPVTLRSHVQPLVEVSS